MTNGNEPTSIVHDTTGNCIHKGLTKREYFAALAMQGILSGYRGNAFFAERIASDSVMLADALINELNKDALIDQLNK